MVSYDDTLTYLMTAGRFLLLRIIVTVGRGVIVACSAVDKILSVQPIICMSSRVEFNALIRHVEINS